MIGGKRGVKENRNVVVRNWFGFWEYCFFFDVKKEQENGNALELN